MEMDPSLRGELEQIMGDRACGAESLAALPSRKSRAFAVRVPGMCSGMGMRCGAVVVLKVYTDSGCAGREACALERLAEAGVRVPEVLGSSEHGLVRAYIHGPLLRDIHWDSHVAREYAAWLFACHTALAGSIGIAGKVGDMNLGNFVVDVNSGEIAGIDFGDTMAGGADVLEDVAEGCMRIFAHKPGFTIDRMECALAFVLEYGRLSGRMEEIREAVPTMAADAFRRHAAWRGGDVIASHMAYVFPELWAQAIGPASDALEPLGLIYTSDLSVPSVRLL